MKYQIGLLTLILTVFISGCAKDGLAINTLSGNTVAREFKQGVVTSQKKVIINDREMAILSGAGLGALGGQVARGDTKGTLIGAGLGVLAGAVLGKEVEAYETTIESGNIIYEGYLQHKLDNGTKVEFTVVEGKLKNVKVLGFEDVKRIYKGVIIERYKKAGLWYYTLENVSNKALSHFTYYKKIPYLRDYVELEAEGKEIVKATLLKREYYKSKAKKITTRTVTKTVPAVEKKLKTETLGDSKEKIQNRRKAIKEIVNDHNEKNNEVIKRTETTTEKSYW